MIESYMQMCESEYGIQCVRRESVDLYLHQYSHFTTSKIQTSWWIRKWESAKMSICKMEKTAVKNFAYTLAFSHFYIWWQCVDIAGRWMLLDKVGLGVPILQHTTVLWQDKVHVLLSHEVVLLKTCYIVAEHYNSSV